MTSVFVFVSGAVLLIFSAERLIGYLVGAASGLKVSLFLLAIVFTGIEFDDIFLGVALNIEDLDEVALGIVFGTALSLPGIVLAIAAILKPSTVSVPRVYIGLFALAPLVMIAFTLMAPLTITHGIVLLGLFAVFLSYIAVRESRGEVPVFRDAEIYEAYVAVRDSRGGYGEQPGGLASVRTVGPDTAEASARGPSGPGFSEHMPFPAARKRSGWAGLGLAVLALTGLIIGAATTGMGAEGIVEDYGIEGTVFGATIVTAVLTIEDIFLTAEPFRKGAPEIGIGNVIGSVVFSVTGKLGVILLAGGLVIGPHVLTWHLPALSVLTWIAAYFMSTGRLQRWHGYTLLVLYIIYWVVSFVALGTVPADVD